MSQLAFINTDDDRTEISESNAVTRYLELNLTKNERRTKMNRRIKMLKKKKKIEINNMAVYLIPEDATKTR